MGLERQAITFPANATIVEIEVITKSDRWLEQTEYFYLNVYEGETDTTPLSYGLGFVENQEYKSYSYELTNNSPSDSPVEEGSEITFTVTRSGSGTESTVYLSTSDGSAGVEDFNSKDTVAISFAPYETVKTVSVSTISDAINEENESFALELFITQSDATPHVTSTAYIKNVEVETDYTYTVTSSADKASPTEEGGNITFTITRSDSGTASTVYLSTLGGNASNSGDDIDYKPLDKSALTFAAYETVKTVTINTYSDSLAEGDEYFWLDLYKTYADAESGAYAAYASGGIKDPEEAAVDYDYTITSSATQNSQVEEGDSITFTITRSIRHSLYSLC